MDVYSRTYEIRFSDIDANHHVNYAAYIDAAADFRYRFFTEHGFPPEKFVELGIGPVYTSLHAEFLREVRMGETITITYALSGMADSGSRWKVHHDILKSNDKKAVMLDIEGVLLDMSTRKMAIPTPELLKTFNQIPRTSDFEVMPETRRMK
jgi:acyl-CoA thioester hydrolase